MDHLIPLRYSIATDKANNSSCPSPSSRTDDLGTFRVLKLDDQTTVSLVTVYGLIAMVLLQAGIVPDCGFGGAVVEAQGRLVPTNHNPCNRFLVRVAEVPAVGRDQVSIV
jgi:hypothetical protein